MSAASGQAPVATPRRVTVSITNYNGRESLPPTLSSILAQDYPHLAGIILADDGSTDDSIAWVRAQHPSVRVVPGPCNRGPNAARNLGLNGADTELVLVMDNDIILRPDYVTRLVAALDAEPTAGAASGQIRFHDDPERVQYQGGVHIHYAGAAVQVQPGGRACVRAGALSAGAALVDRAKALAVGGFDEEFRFGWEDGDFFFRLGLAGFANLTVPGAVCLHLKQKRGLKWVRYQVRNRWWFMLKNYDARTLVLAFPAIAFYQLCIGAVCLMKGRGVDFVRGSFDVLATWPALRRKRHAVMAIKTRGDRGLLCGDAIDTLGDTGNSAVVRLGNAVTNRLLAGYWWCLRPLLRA